MVPATANPLQPSRPPAQADDEEPRTPPAPAHRSFGAAPLLLAWGVVVALVTWGVVHLSSSNDLPLDAMTRDPIAVLRGDFYIGFVSQLGAVCWTIGATSALLAWSVLRRVPGRVREARFLAHAALLTTFIGLDDLFLVHERVVPRHLGWVQGELVIELLWAALALALALRHLRVLMDPRTAVFAIGSLALLAISNGLDLLLPDSLNRQFYEDIPKFAGVVGWMLFLAMFAARQLAEVAADSRGHDGVELVDPQRTAR